MTIGNRNLEMALALVEPAAERMRENAFRKVGPDPSQEQIDVQYVERFISETKGVLGGLKDCGAVFVALKRGDIALPPFRSMCDLYGELINGEQAQQAEIQRLRDRVADLEQTLSDRLEGSFIAPPGYVMVPQSAGAQDWRHAANEWADMATSGLQWLRNIDAGTSTVDQAILNMEELLAHCKSVSDAAPSVAQGEPYCWWAKTTDPDRSCIFWNESDAQTEVNDHGGEVVALYEASAFAQPPGLISDAPPAPSQQGEPAAATAWSLLSRAATALDNVAEFPDSQESMQSALAAAEDMVAEVSAFLHAHPTPAQQPAVVAQGGEEIMVNAAHDVYTLPLKPSGLTSGPRFVVHVPAPEQPAVPEGWRIERTEDDRIIVQKKGVVGYVAAEVGKSGIAESALYYLADALLSAQPAEQNDPTVREAAQFLLDRLSESAPDDMSESSARDWYGHVVPAIERLGMALRAQAADGEGQ